MTFHTRRWYAHAAMRRVLAISTRCELAPLALTVEPRIENLANLLWDQVSSCARACGGNSTDSRSQFEAST